MNVFERIKALDQSGTNSDAAGLFADIAEELATGLRRYWSAAAGILKGSGIRLLKPPAEYDSLEKNFFSTLFLYSYHRAGISRSRCTLYAAVIQCLRGMVTACDNILDDEYKETLATDLPRQGIRFRSVLDIMVSDRVLFELLMQSHREDELTHEQVRLASFASLSGLARSGAQEAAEEAGVGEILKPASILRSVHNPKTGILFQSPWALPEVIETPVPRRASRLKAALWQIGMGCQILDDMVDLPKDLRKRRHNYVASLIYHTSGFKERDCLTDWLSSAVDPNEAADLVLDFPRARRSAALKAGIFLKAGITALLAPEHHALVEPCMAFLAERIGAGRFMPDLSDPFRPQPDGS